MSNNTMEAIGNLDINKPAPEPDPDPEYFDESQLSQHWAYKAIQYTLNEGLFQGFLDGGFYPNVRMSRAMFVTVLGRMSGISPEDYRENPFVDVGADYYAAPYIDWASKEGIVIGTNLEKKLFDPDGLITREQMAVIIDRYLGDNVELLETQEEVAYQDAEIISSYAKESVRRCTMLQLLMGNEKHDFCPGEHTTRAQAATVFMRVQNYIRNHSAAEGSNTETQALQTLE